MSTSAALPAGASLLSISGRRCTAIPKTDAAFLSSILQTFLPGQSGSPSAAQVTTTAPPALTTSAASTASTTSSTAEQAAPAILPPAPAVAPPQTTSSNIPPPVASSPPPAAPPSTSIVSSSSSSAPSTLSTSSSSSSSLLSLSSSSSSSSSSTSSSSSSSSSSTSSPPTFQTSSSPAAAAIPQQSTTPIAVSSTSSADPVAAKTTSTTPSTPPVVQSDNSPVATSTNDVTLSGTRTTTTSSSSLTSIPSSTAAAAATQATTSAAAATSGSKMAVGPMVGGILGGFAFIGLVSFIVWYLRRRKRRRDSFLTPLGSDPGDPSRSSSPSDEQAATTPIQKFKAQVGSKLVVVGVSISNLKNRVKGGQKGTVNMNRGNSQFLERIPQHSRQNSALSGQQSVLTARERFGEWFDRTRQDILFKLRVNRKEPADPFAASREKPKFNPGDSDFSQLLAMEQNELQIAAERRRQSLARANQLGSGSLGLNFNISNPTQGQADPFADPTNPFNDPANVVSPPKPSQQPSSGYIADVRRSRGSIAHTIDSRYPSTYAPDRDTYGYRDTYMTSDTSGRKTKGRSDPFDLEKLQLDSRAPPMPANETSMNAFVNASDMAPRVVSQAISEVSSMGTYSSKYSSGISDFGEPGPDLGASQTNLNYAGHARDDSDAIGPLVRNMSNGGSERSVGKAI